MFRIAKFSISVIGTVNGWRGQVDLPSIFHYGAVRVLAGVNRTVRELLAPVLAVLNDWTWCAGYFTHFITVVSSQYTSITAW